MLTPQAGVRTLSCTAFAQEQHRLVLIYNTTAMYSQGIFPTGHQSIAHPQCKAKEIRLHVATQTDHIGTCLCPKIEAFPAFGRQDKQVSLLRSAERAFHIFILQGILYFHEGRGCFARYKLKVCRPVFFHQERTESRQLVNPFFQRLCKSQAMSGYLIKSFHVVFNQWLLLGHNTTRNFPCAQWKGW